MPGRRGEVVRCTARPPNVGQSLPRTARHLERQTPQEKRRPGSVRAHRAPPMAQRHSAQTNGSGDLSKKSSIRPSSTPTGNSDAIWWSGMLLRCRRYPTCWGWGFGWRKTRHHVMCRFGSESKRFGGGKLFFYGENSGCLKLWPSAWQSQHESNVFTSDHSWPYRRNEPVEPFCSPP